MADVTLTPDRHGVYASLTDRKTGFTYAWVVRQPPFVVFPSKSEVPCKTFGRLVTAAHMSGRGELAIWLETKARGNSRLFVCDSKHGNYDITVNWADRARRKVVHLFAYSVEMRKFKRHVADLPSPPENEDDGALITKDEFLDEKGARKCGSLWDMWFTRRFANESNRDGIEMEEDDDKEEPASPGAKWDMWFAHFAVNDYSSEDEEDDDEEEEHSATLGAIYRKLRVSSHKDEYKLPPKTLAHEYVRHHPDTLRIRRSNLEEEAVRIFDDHDRPLMVIMKSGIVLDVTQRPTKPIKSGWTLVREKAIEALGRAIGARRIPSPLEIAKSRELVYLAHILHYLGPKKIRISPGCGLGDRFEVSAITDKIYAPFRYQPVAVWNRGRVELKKNSRELNSILQSNK